METWTVERHNKEGNFIIQSNKCTTYIYINNIMYNISTPTCSNVSASSSGRLALLFHWSYRNHSVLLIATQKKHQHTDYTYKTAQILHAATKQTTCSYCNNTWQHSTFYRVYFINCKHFYLLVLLSFVTLMIYVTLAK